MTLAARFWEKVDVRGPDECWPWKASTDGHGYGAIWLGHLNRMGKASRVSWVLHNGQIPEGMCVLHRCDNPPCCNPGHLFLGTKADNMADKYAKGREGNPRRHKGEHHHNSKLTRNEAMAILFLCRHSSFSQRQIAKQFGVSQVTVGRINSGAAWSDLRRPPLYIEGLGT